MKRLAPIGSAGIFAVLGGCIAVGPDYERPEVETDAEWAAGSDSAFNSADPASIETWWQALDDAVLDDLVERAFASNLDLATAVQRVRQTAAIRGISAGERFPDLDGTGSFNRERQGENAFPGRAAPTEFDSFAMGLEFGWELDVWGRVRRLVEAADADLASTVEDLHDVRLLLAAEVASEYVELRTAQQRLRVAERNIEIQRQSLTLTTTRFENGAAPQLDVAQAETNLANTEAELPSLRADVRDRTLRLAVLLGENPTALLDELSEPVGIPEPPSAISVGIPADVLRRRPDIRSAERELAGEVARIGVELGDLYPRFSLGGSLQFNSRNVGSLYDADSLGFGIGPSFSWNLFDGGRERNEVRAQKAAADIAVLAYRSAVLAALEDVESAMFRHARQIERTDAFRRASDAANLSAELSRQLYLEGRSDFQNVLDSERELFAAEDSLIVSRSEVTTTYITLQRSLGGGWTPPIAEERQAEDANATGD
ncbi:MAG: efflux transporter outer membrane subunit [Planctomycetota bacterium]